MQKSSADKLEAFRRRKEVSSQEFPLPPKQNYQARTETPVVEDEELSSESDHSPSRPSTHESKLSANLPASIDEGKAADKIDSGLLAPSSNHPHSLTISTMYLQHTEQSIRMSILTSEQNTFFSAIVLPYTKQCERVMRVAVKECESLKSRLVASRQRRHVETAREAVSGDDQAVVDSECASAKTTELRSLVNILQQQLKDQRLRFDQELARVTQRREREVRIIQEQSEKQIRALEQQVQLLKKSHEEHFKSASRIQEDLREVDRSLPREFVPLSTKSRNTEVVNKTSTRRTPSRSPSQPLSPALPQMLLSTLACPSANPRHSTVVASMNGTSWRSIYLVVNPQGVCSYGESTAGPTSPLFTLNEVTTVKLGSSKHAQRPLMLSINYSGGRQIDIALSDKSEREFWRQAFKVHRKEDSPALRVDPMIPAHNADSVASTPSLSSANPVVADAESPSLKRWLEAQADNVRRGDLDADTSLNNNDANTPDGESGSEAAERKKSVHSSPTPQRPPLATGTRDITLTTMSTSSRDRLPPLAPQHKRRSTISGSASTADSLTEDDGNDTAPRRRALISHSDEPIAPVSPSHSTDSGASPPSSEESIQLSPELSPVIALTLNDDVPIAHERRR